MNTIISRSQSAFIKTRSIHDNYLYVRNYARRLHKAKTSALLLKLDIKKAFDSVRWDYLVDLLQRLGFPPRFRNWLVAILHSASSRVLLNGVPGSPLAHGQGLRQGDPLSPLLFVLAIDPLQAILTKATDNGDLHRLRGRATTMRTSLYADDAVIFMVPKREDMEMLSRILKDFGEVTGLVTNVNKSMVVPIRCSEINIDEVLHGFPATRSSFPITYLGLPLSVHRLRSGHFQYIVDKMASKLPLGQGKYVTTAGRVQLVKSVITSQAIYPLTVLPLPKGILKAMTKLERAFVWAASDKVSGGKCKVKWEVVCSPKNMGGLGILDLEKFGKALRVRWPWHEWTDPGRAWVGLGNPCTKEDMNLFYDSIDLHIGNGKTASFWHTPWLEGRKPIDIAPSIFSISKKKNFTVHKGLEQDFWILNLSFEDGITVDHISEFTTAWTKIQHVLLNDEPDHITWRLSNTGSYSSSTAYLAQFDDTPNSYMMPAVWNNWAPPKCKTFAWLILQNKVWTSDRLMRRGWPNCGPCQLCKREPESAAHLIFKCRYSMRVWNGLKEWLGLADFDTSLWNNYNTLPEWWCAISGGNGRRRKGLTSLLLLTAWELWNERNARVFRNVASMPMVVTSNIKSSAALWGIAGAKYLSALMPRE
jgi:hypothetical protein